MLAEHGESNRHPGPLVADFPQRREGPAEKRQTREAPRKPCARVEGFDLGRE